MRSAEPWSNGPEPGTVWALDGDTPVVVHIGTVAKPNVVQREYSPPGKPVAPPAKALREMAHEILRQRWLDSLRETWYGRKFLREHGHDPAMPTDAQIAAAEQVIAIERHNEEVDLTYRKGHTATGAVGAERFFDLWKADLPCTETDSSEE